MYTDPYIALRLAEHQIEQRITDAETRRTARAARQRTHAIDRGDTPLRRTPWDWFPARLRAERPSALAQ